MLQPPQRPLTSPSEIAASVADPAPVLQLIVVSAVEILHGSAGVIALVEEEEDERGGERLRPRASYGLPGGAVASLHPRLDRAILGALGQLEEQVSLLYLPAAGLGDWAYRYHLLALPLPGTHVPDSSEKIRAERVATHVPGSAEKGQAERGREKQLLGVIYVFRPLSAPGFTPRDLQVLDVFARQAGGALEQAQATAEMLAEKTRLEEMQSTFVSIVSHELQTPVSIIKSYAATLGREDASWPSKTVQRVTTNIEEECDRLTRLISDLLDLSRLQAGRVAMRIGAVDLPELAQEVLSQLSSRAPNHALRASFPATFPLVQGDADQLRRALFNLVENAVKYSPQGGEVLVVGELPPSAAPDGASAPPQVLVRVLDQGIGIPESEGERIFQRFHRADTRLSRSTQGVGLGLYITRTIVEAHGGHIWAENRTPPARGAIFTMALPLQPPPRGEAHAE